MAFSTDMISMLKANPSLRREMFAAKKAAGGIGKGLTPSKEAKQIVESLNKQEEKILNSPEYRKAFDQLVKPEMSPYQAKEDLLNKGYWYTEQFWKDCPQNYEKYVAFIHKNNASHRSPAVQELKSMTMPNEATQAYIKEMKQLRAIQGELDGKIDRSKLKMVTKAIDDGKVKAQEL